MINLAVFGFPLPPGVPSLVGPLNVFDARVFVTQSIFDLNQINGARAAAHDVAAARYSYKSARDLVVLVAANLYLQALASSARADSARAQMDTAQALYNQAVDLKQGGLVAGIDVLRAQVQFNTEQQRATATANDFEKAKLQLARVIGLPVGQAFTLTDQIPYAPVPEMTLEQALDRAYKTRPDYQAALERVRAAEASRAAALATALPSVHVTADFGDLGLTPRRRARHLRRHRRAQRADLPGRPHPRPAARSRRRSPHAPRGGRRHEGGDLLRRPHRVPRSAGDRPAARRRGENARARRRAAHAGARPLRRGRRQQHRGRAGAGAPSRWPTSNTSAVCTATTSRKPRSRAPSASPKRRCDSISEALVDGESCSSHCRPRSWSSRSSSASGSGSPPATNRPTMPRLRGT